MVLIAVLLALGAWRVAQGPVDITWLTARLENALNTADSPVRVHIGGTALAWEGFHRGVDRPIDLRLTDVSVTDAADHQRLSVPQAKVSLSVEALLQGRLRLRAVELDQPRLLVRRTADGTLVLDLGSQAAPAEPDSGTQLPALLQELARPPATDRTAMRGWISQIRRVRIRDADITMQDHANGMTWHAPHADLDLVRGSQGGVQGTGKLILALGKQTAELHATATLPPGATDYRVSAELSPVKPAELAHLLPVLAPLEAFTSPVSLTGSVLLDSRLDPRQFQLRLDAGPGLVRVGQSDLPILSATASLEGSKDAARLTSAQLKMRGHPDGPVTTLDASGTLRRDGTGIQAVLSLDLDQVAFADLPQLWPVGTGGGARPWITDNITAGIAHDGHVNVTVTAKPDLSDLALTQAQGTLAGDGLTVHWLRPVPPVEDGRAQLRIVDPDTLEITVLGGQQSLRNSKDTLAITSGTMRISGLMHDHQVGTIDAQISGSLPDALALLREPRLQLLSAHPIRLANPAGQAAVTLSAQVPLEDKVSVDDIPIHAVAHLTGAHLDGVVAGRSLDAGTLDLDATNDGLKVTGTARLAGIPAELDGTMDFRAGGPTEVVQRVHVSGRPDVRQLAAAGLDATPVLSGPVPVRAELTQQRNGIGTLTVAADLTPTEIQLDPLAWRKPAGTPAKASLQLQLVKDRLDAVDPITVQGDGLSVQGSAGFTGGRLSLLRLDRLVLGRTDLHGTVRMPATPGAPIAVSLAGPALDLAARLERKTPPTPRPLAEPPPGPAWTLDASFARVLMAHGYVLAPVRVEAENDGRKFNRLYVAGDTRAHAPFALRIAPEGHGRRLTATAMRAGDLLRALDWLGTMQEGRLSVTGTYDDASPGHPLRGTLELTDFRVREAAGLGKLLQAMTLYGLVDALRGPGLSFNRAVVPFQLSDGLLDLQEARAFSASLGLTAKGRVDLDARRVDLQGTIVPAYFFNSLLGRLPVVGKLLSPERGGGLFAASYTLRGKLDDPDVSVNPLTALTPGFLRGLFGAM